MGGDVAMDQAPAVMLDHNKHVQQTKGRGYRNEEIAGNDSLGVQAQEGRPVQVTSWLNSRPPAKILIATVLTNEPYDRRGGCGVDNCGSTGGFVAASA